MVVIVEDERTIAELERLYLTQAGFGVHVASDGATGLADIRRLSPVAVIVDVGLPGLDGTELVRRLRAEGDWVPVVFVTAHDSEIDRVVGLELGADDYITKPFSPREVVARIRAVMRRTGQHAVEADGADVLHVNGLEIDLGEHEVRIQGRPAHLTPSEFRILTVLAKQPGHAFTRAHLLDVLGDDGSVYERTLDRHINNLRKKIEPDPEHPTYVQTVFGVGYKFKKT